MFKAVTPKVDINALEQDQLAFWREQDVFQRTMDERKGGRNYVFYEGPPTANGRPGTHHVLARAFKDMFPRYNTMNGAYVLRKGGWDTHGLPVEIEVEKELGFTHKHEIEEYGIAEFNEKCRESVFRYIKEWEAPDRAHRVLGGSGQRLCDLHQRLHPERVVDSAPVLGQGSALPGLQGGALLRALRHAA